MKLRLSTVMQVLIKSVCVLVAFCLWSTCSAQVPGDEDDRCTVDSSNPPVYPDTVKNLMDSYNYVSLLPGNGTGYPLNGGAVWNDQSVDGNDAIGTAYPTYWQQGTGGICRFESRVCGWRREGARQNNWLFTQHISKDFELSTYPHPVEIQVELVHSLMSCRERLGCRTRFNLLKYTTNTQQLPSTVGSGFMNSENYELISEIRPPRSGLTYTTTFPFTLQSTETGFYLAIQDTGTCVAISRMRVYHNNCQSRQTGLVLYPDVPAPVTGSVDVNVSCVSGAAVSGSPQVSCASDGMWGPQRPVCQCVPGYESRQRECIACPAGLYRSSFDSGCQECPAHTVTSQEAAPLCECLSGYFRNDENTAPAAAQPYLSSSDETANEGCTRSPSAPRSVSLVPGQTSMAVSWSPPVDNGGRSDLYYQLEYSDPDNTGLYTGTVFLSGVTTRHTVTGLIPFTNYCVRIIAHNGVSDQDPQTAKLRTQEVCNTTQEGLPSIVTGVGGYYPAVLWNPPARPNGVITGYRLRFTRSGSSTIITSSGELTFYVIKPGDLPWTSGYVSLTVAAGTRVGFQSDSEPFTFEING